MSLPTAVRRPLGRVKRGLVRLRSRAAVTAHRSDRPAHEMTVSVIIPIYNVEAYLDECLHSVRTQRHRRLQILVVDDGSPDRSADIARSHAAEDDRITVIRQANGGLGAARNTGVRHATGDYLFFVDSDDVVPPDAVSAMLAAAVKSGSDIVAAPATRFNSTRRWRPDWVECTTRSGCTSGSGTCPSWCATTTPGASSTRPRSGAQIGINLSKRDKSVIDTDERIQHETDDAKFGPRGKYPESIGADVPDGSAERCPVTSGRVVRCSSSSDLVYDDMTWQALPGMFQTLISAGAMQLCLVENRGVLDTPSLIAFCGSIFVTDRFCREARTKLPPYLGLQIARRFSKSKLPVLDRNQVAFANSKTGVTVMTRLLRNAMRFSLL